MSELNSEKEKVVVTKDDIDNIENFFNHFNIPIPDQLSRQIAVWRQKSYSGSFLDQEELKAAVSHAMITTEHEIIQNDVWKGVLKNCDETYFKHQFDKDLEEVLTEKE